MDALPVLLILGYLLGSLNVIRLVPREGPERLLAVAAQMAGGMLLGHLLVQTSVGVAASGLGTLLGLYFPARMGRTRVLPDASLLVASATFSAILMPMGFAAGLLVFALIYARTRRRALSVVIALFFVPWLAWYLTGSDLLLLTGGLVWVLLIFRYMDRLEMQVRELLGRRSSRLLFRKIAHRVILVVVLLSMFSLFFLNRYVYHGFGLHPEVFRRGGEELEYIALTFDDGPDPAFTPAILDILAERGVRATFFVVGKHVDQYPEIVQRIKAEGHEIGNHTYNHVNLLYAGEEMVTRELARTEAALEEAVGLTPKLFRPPRGLYNETTLRVAHERGYTLALWSLSSEDWLGISPTRIVRVLGDRATGGDILLFHDSGDFLTTAGANRDNVIQSVGPLLDRLHDRDYRFVTVTELMAMTLLTDGGDVD